MGRKQWFAVDVHVFDSDLGVDIRERFGVVGLAMWVGFLAACKRNIVPGKIRYSSEAEALSMLGLPGVDLVDEEYAPFTLDEFWTFLGQRKQTKVTRSKRLTNVSATRWEQWQNDARTERERERKRRSRAEDARTENGRSADEKRTDRDSDRDNYRDIPPQSSTDEEGREEEPVTNLPHRVALVLAEKQTPGTIRSMSRWLATTAADVKNRPGWQRDVDWLEAHHPDLRDQDVDVALASRHSEGRWPTFVSVPNEEPEAWKQIVPPSHLRAVGDPR